MATTSTGSLAKSRGCFYRETAPAVQRVMWNSSTVQQEEIHAESITSTITLVTSTQSSPLVTSSGTDHDHPCIFGPAQTCPSPVSADVTADIAKYTSKMMDAIKGTMTEIYNDLSMNTTGSTITEIHRLRIEIGKLSGCPAGALGNETQLGADHGRDAAEPRAGVGPAHCRGVKKQLELEKQQAVGRNQDAAVVCQLPRRRLSSTAAGTPVTVTTPARRPIGSST